MNHCIFTGYLEHDPELEPGGNDETNCCTFQLTTYEHVRNKGGEKKSYPTTMTFRIWHTGAKALVKLGREGMKLTVYASAKNGTKQTRTDDDIIFRVNEFDFGCLNRESR